MKSEDDYIDKARKSYNLGNINVSSVGSCLISSIIYKDENNDYNLIIANMGDSGISLISNNDGRYTGRRLSNIHNCNNKNEIELLINKHYDEDDIIVLKNNEYYVKGLLMPTRTIGDLRMKLNEFADKKFRNKYNLVNMP